MIICLKCKRPNNPRFQHNTGCETFAKELLAEADSVSKALEYLWNTLIPGPSVTPPPK